MCRFRPNDSKTTLRYSILENHAAARVICIRCLPDTAPLPQVTVCVLSLYYPSENVQLFFSIARLSDRSGNSLFYILYFSCLYYIIFFLWEQALTFSAESGVTYKAVADVTAYGSGGSESDSASKTKTCP